MSTNYERIAGTPEKLLDLTDSLDVCIPNTFKAVNWENCPYRPCRSKACDAFTLEWLQEEAHE